MQEFASPVGSLQRGIERLHKLATSFVLGYHGCDANVGERLLRKHSFKASQNDYDWLGEGVYFWESNPLRGLEFARETAARKSNAIRKPMVVGAVIDLGNCLDLTTSRGLSLVRTSFERLKAVQSSAGVALPVNSTDGLRHNLDCAVLNYLHRLRAEEADLPFDTVRGIFVEMPALYEGSAFGSKNHIQIAVRNTTCIKGVFRVLDDDLNEKG